MKSQAPKSASSKIDLTWATENQTVWIMLPEDHPSGEACNQGYITKLIDEESVQIKVEKSEDLVVIKGDKIYPLNNYRDYPNGYDDMVDMENLSEAELLNNLRIRFQLDMIYTYVGPTLIVMNPYKRIDKLLLPTIMKNFQNALKPEKFELKEHMPHVYAIAAMTMKNLLDNKRNQAIVISGESGAGKTENTKSAMKFLTSLGKEEDALIDSGQESIEDKILACNPVLEAFGNAKTVRNDNSSRFGKYVALLVEKDSSKIVGATITNYLLEKSRVVTQNSDERNYHIFYAFLRGASEDTLKKYFLTKNLDDWAFLKNSFKDEVKTVPDDELYKEVMDSFHTMKFSENEQDTIWTYTAAALTVGNIDFDDSGFDDTNPCKLKNEQYLKNAAKILNVDFEKLSKALRNKTRVIGGSTIDSTIKKEECIMFRDALAKELYNKLFNWLVRRLNFTVMPPEFTKGGINMPALMKNYYHIGLLDIFGFEIFKVNSLEQFCINFSNEKLQQLYIAYVFKGEEKEFIGEGLNEYLCELTYKDNQGLIEMLDAIKVPGIFQMIDESCTINNTDQNLYEKIVKQCKKPELPLTTAKLARDTFIIKHTAKDVEYNINGFRAKNKDEISKTIEDTICNSTSANVVRVWKNLCLDETESEEAKNARPNPKDKFLGYKFRVQMKDLMEELNSCECQFIRCLKPNEKKQADFFLPQLVLQQIKYMGVLDTIKVRKDTFPARTTYKNFYEKYQDLDPKASRISFEKHLEMGSDFMVMAKKICEEKFSHHITGKKILYGNTKLFLRVEAAKEIERIRRDIFMRKHRAAKKFQKAWFYFKQMRIWRDMIKGMKLLQEAVRIRMEYLKFLNLRRTCAQIQRWWRGILYKERNAKILKIAPFIQNWWKMVYQQRKYKKLTSKVKTMNRIMRGAIARRKVRILKACKLIMEDLISQGAVIVYENYRIRQAIKIQKCWRGHFCRKNFSKFVEQIRIARENFVKNKAAKKIQKRVRGHIVRATVKRMHKAAGFIQGYMRMKWLSTFFQKLRVVAVIIQKAVRRWLITHKARSERYKHFMSTEGKDYQNLLIAEQANFFGIYNLSKIEKGVENYLPLLKPRVEEPVQDDDSFEDTQASEGLPTHEPLKTQAVGPEGYDTYVNPEDFTGNFALNPIRAVDPYTAKKIDLFSKIIDVEVLCDTSSIYDPIWSLQMLQLQKECYSTGIDTQLIEIGQAHTTVIPSTGKVYSFGWNDCMQLGRATESGETSPCEQIEFSLENFRPKSIAAGDDHNLLFDYQGTLYTWGDNSKGQLGLGHRKPTPKIIVQDFSPNDPVHEIKAKGSNNLVITESGKAYYWPRVLSSGEKIYRPTELTLPAKTQVLTAACGYNFAVLVAKNGLVFTFGQDNKAGQLGHGDIKPRDTPTVVETLKNEGEMAMGVACGFKHVIVKTKLGKVYSWGWGLKGQLGHGETQNELRPRLVNMTQHNQAKIKAVQVQAGYAHSMVVLENRKLLWWGTNGSLECQTFPVEVDLQKKISDYQKEFTPLKVLCSWSKTMNVTYVTIADSRTSDINPTTKNKVLATLVSKMEEACAFNEVDIPYVESLVKYFPLKIMKDRSALAKAPSAIKKIAGIPQLNKASEAGGPPHHLESLAIMRTPRQQKEPELPKQNLLTTPRLAQTKQTMAPKLFGMDSARQYASTGQKVPSSIGSPRLLTTVNHKSINTAEPNIQSLPSQRVSTRNVDKGKMRNTTTSGSPPLLSSRNNKEKEKEKERKESPRKVPEQKDNGLDNLNKKLYDIKKKMEKIKASPKETWSKADAEFIKITSEPKLRALLETIELSKDAYNS